ncbi:hypothetical protein [Pontibacter sp. G13]|uniref:hypothetical protein n=1 Tax=Pontibacter sp. G13 TaxID=3074898 RepID=UPI00288A3A74|nr:hypothetical protein [Pontibacter sp. G13]WNJ17015.1 hypothetical protein RJD25_19345 [Pontibacter sp. G13]
MNDRMMTQSSLVEVAKGLGNLLPEVLFVGGAVVSLYSDSDEYNDFRPTYDIDMVIEIIGMTQWQAIIKQLRDRGFHPDPKGHSICRYLYRGIPVDIVSTEDGPFGPSNPWYKTGQPKTWEISLDGVRIRLLSTPCFIATKFEAFRNRGTDYRFSHDIEDIIFLVETRSTLLQEIHQDLPEVQTFIASEFQKIQSKGLLEEVLMAHIQPSNFESTYTSSLELIRQILHRA